MLFLDLRTLSTNWNAMLCGKLQNQLNCIDKHGTSNLTK